MLYEGIITILSKLPLKTCVHADSFETDSCSDKNQINLIELLVTHEDICFWLLKNTLDIKLAHVDQGTVSNFYK